MPSDVVHIKLEYGEANNGKRSILLSEVDSLKAATAIGKYRSWRIAELAAKGRLYSKLKEARSTIKSLQVLFPEPKIPRILKRKNSLEEKSTEPNTTGPKYQSGDIESQLSEIQRRLASLSG